MTAIFKREFHSFFHGMLGYVLTAFLVASSGLYFLARCLIYGLTDFSYYTLSIMNVFFYIISNIFYKVLFFYFLSIFI